MMTKYIWPSRKSVAIRSFTWHESQAFPGVEFSIRQVSLLGRMELMQALRDLVANHEFLQAGNCVDQTEAAISDLLAKKLYVEWGLCEIRGLTIDGKPPDVSKVVSSAPETLVNEIVDCIRQNLELSETERKNS